MILFTIASKTSTVNEEIYEKWTSFHPKKYYNYIDRNWIRSKVDIMFHWLKDLTL